MEFAEMHPFKGMETYFTDSLLYKENSKVVEKLLPNVIAGGNEATQNQEKIQRFLLMTNQL